MSEFEISPELRKQIDIELQAAWQRGFSEGHRRAKTKFLLTASDEMNRMVNALWRSHRELLQGWANELQRPLHTAIPGEAAVTPYNSPPASLENQTPTPGDRTDGKPDKTPS